MFHILDKIREKPEPKRRFYALLITFSLTAIIFGIWLSVVTTQGLSDSNKMMNNKDSAKEQENIENSPIESLKDSAIRMYKDIKERIPQEWEKK